MGPEQLRTPGPPSLRDARDFGPPLPATGTHRSLASKGAANEEKGGNLVPERPYASLAVERG